jgi:hypothetical protein
VLADACSGGEPADDPGSAEEERGAGAMQPGPGAGGAGGSSTTDSPARQDAGPRTSGNAARPLDAESPGSRDAGRASEVGALDVPGGSGAVGIDRKATIPVVWIEVPTAKTPGNLGREKVKGTLRLIEDHDGSHQDLKARPSTLEGPIGVAMRGNYSGTFAQKSLSLELRDAAGMEQHTSLFGWPAESDYALIACWIDKTCMRHALAYELGREMGRWSPRTRHVEVIFNGDYQGLYLLVEVPRQGKGRVPIAKPAPEASMGDLTGGYIFRREGIGRGTPRSKPLRDWVSTEASPDEWQHRMVYTYHYPQEDQITPAQKAYLHGYVARFEALMKSPSWADAAMGYRSMIDVASWVDYSVMAELSNNLDSYYKSVYFAKESDAKGGRLSMMPLWDYDLAFGNSTIRDGVRTDLLNFGNGKREPNGGCTPWLPAGPPHCDTPDCCMGRDVSCTGKKCYTMPFMSFWSQRLVTDPAYLEDLKCRWRELRKGPLALSNLEAKIDAWRAVLLPLAVPRHFKKWPQSRQRILPNPCGRARPEPCGDPKAPIDEYWNHEVNWMRGWIDRRMTWLDQNLPGSCDR